MRRVAVDRWRRRALQRHVFQVPIDNNVPEPKSTFGHRNQFSTREPIAGCCTLWTARRDRSVHAPWIARGFP
jgi:hypothetical protein